MLVLTRRVTEAIAVGGEGPFEHLLKITVLEIRNGSVRLGFEVDASVPVHRWEVWQKIHGAPASVGSLEGLESAILK